MRRSLALVICGAALVVASPASADGSGASMTVEILRGSTLTQTCPSGQHVTLRMGGDLLGYALPGDTAAGVAYRIWGATAYGRRPKGRSPTCDGSVVLGRPAYGIFGVATDVVSTITYAPSGRVTFSWTPPGSTISFTGSAPRDPDGGPPWGAPRTITLRGTVQPRDGGLSRLVLRGRSGDIPVAGGTASFRLKLITKTDF